MSKEEAKAPDPTWAKDDTTTQPSKQILPTSGQQSQSVEQVVKATTVPPKRNIAASMGNMNNKSSLKVKRQINSKKQIHPAQVLTEMSTEKKVTKDLGLESKDQENLQLRFLDIQTSQQVEPSHFNDKLATGKLDIQDVDKKTATEVDDAVKASTSINPMGTHLLEDTNTKLQFKATAQVDRNEEDEVLCSHRSIDPNQNFKEINHSKINESMSHREGQDDLVNSSIHNSAELKIDSEQQTMEKFQKMMKKNIDSKKDQEELAKRIQEQPQIQVKVEEKSKNTVRGEKFILNYSGKQKEVEYDYRSCYIFKYNTKFRYGIVWFTEWKYFDYFIILLIAMNSIMLAFQDFQDRVIQAELDDPEYMSERNQKIDTAGGWFSIFFTIECALKIISMGFFRHKNSYLRDAWNWLDFIVVIVGILEMTPIPSANMKAMRTLRVLRPLKSIKSFKSMRKLINSLLISIKSLGNAVIFMFFIFLLFGIFGVHQFNGLFYNRCRMTEFAVDGQWEIDYSIDHLCNSENYICPPDRYCGMPLDQNLPLSIDKVYDQPLINYGIVTFDNLAIGLITIFQMITLEGWTNIMYNLQDSESTKGMSVFFCVSIVFIGSFFLLNVILAVLSEALEKVDQAEKTESKEENQRQDTEVPQKSAIHPSDQEEQIINQQKKTVDMDTANEKVIKKAGQANKEKVTLDTKGKKETKIADQSIAQKELETNKKGIQRTCSGVPIPERAQKNFFYRFCFTICTADLFTAVITLLIIGNTFVLSLDRYPLSEEVNATYDQINNILSWCFVAEMIIKLFGLGFKEYAKDQFNLFDAVVVVLSLVDMGIEMSGVEFGTGGALSAFRGIRLLRVFKLARSWTSFRNLLAKIFETVKDISNFTVLLALFMFIMTLLGMELFAYDVNFNDDDDIVPIGTPGSHPPRENFNTFYIGLITIFVVFIGEDWNTVMYNHERATGVMAIFFFVFLFIFGNLVLLNLFLAILLQNFDDDSANEKKDLALSDETSIKKTTLRQKAKMRCKQLCSKCCKCFKQKHHPTIETPDQGSMQLQLSPDGKIPEMSSVEDSSFSNNASQSKVDEIQEERDQIEKDKQEDTAKLNPKDTLLPPISASKKSQSDNSYQEYMGQNENDNQMSIQQKAPKKQRTSSNISEQPIVNETQQQQDDPISVNTPNIVADNVPGNQQDGHSPDRANTIKTSEISDKGPYISLEPPERQIQTTNKKSKSQRFLAVRSSSTNRLTLTDTKKNNLKNKSFTIRKQSKIFKRMDSVIQDLPWWEGRNMDICTMKRIELIESKKVKRKDIVLEGNALFFLSPENRFRRFCANIVSYQHFDNFILIMILISTFMLTLESPLDDPNSEKIYILEILDKVMTGIFTMECLLKIITFGFIINGSDSYLRLAWNVNDFIIVAVSLISLMPSNDLDLGFFKVLRMLRVLRPLRMISRNPGLKIAVTSLINAIPGIGNLMVIALLVLLLFGILGTNFYKGLFYECDMESVAEENHELIIDKWTCIDFGGEWINFSANFDNVFNSVITLFIITTTEGWTQIMWRAVDSTSINMMPIRDNDEAATLFFVCFVIIGSLFILNLFVGVVINTFNIEKEKLSHNALLTPLQNELAEIEIKCYQLKPEAKYISRGNKFVDLCHYLSKNKNFEMFILVCIILNTITLSLKWYDKNPQKEADKIATLKDVLDIINIVFTIIYTVEAFVKLVAQKLKYFKDGWNVFDFLIVVAAWAGILLDQLFGINLGSGTTVIRSFRIARVLKIIKNFPELRKFFLTFVMAIPELANVGGLLFLFIFLYAVLGVFLFAEVKLQGVGLTRHANFQDFEIAMLTLFRISTGEAWNDIMFDAARQRSILFQCKDMQTYEEIVEFGPQLCGNPVAALVFFPSFMIVVSFIFLNLFIAIILEGFSNQEQADEERLQEADFEIFKKSWQQYDHKAKGMISTDHLEDLILDIIVEEIKIQNKRAKENSDELGKRIVFNLHKNKYLYSYTLDKRQEELKGVIEPQKDDNMDQATKNSLNRIYKKQMHEFIGTLKIPTYNKIKQYNFYDTLISLVYYLFAEELGPTEEDKLLTEEEIKNLAGVELEAYEQNQEKDFQNVMNCFEDKGMQKAPVILKLKNLKEIRKQRGMKLRKQLDYLGNEIINSLQVQGAKTIQRILVEKQERRKTIAENIAKQKRNKMLAEQEAREQQKLLDEQNATQIPHYNTEQQEQEKPSHVLETANNYNTEKFAQEKHKDLNEIMIIEQSKSDRSEQLDNIKKVAQISNLTKKEAHLINNSRKSKNSANLVSSHESVKIDHSEESFHSQLSKQLAANKNKKDNDLVIKSNKISIDQSRKAMLGKINTITNIKSASFAPSAVLQGNKSTIIDKELQKLIQNTDEDNPSSQKSRLVSEEKKFDPLVNQNTRQEPFSPILTQVDQVLQDSQFKAYTSEHAQSTMTAFLQDKTTQNNRSKGTKVNKPINELEEIKTDQQKNNQHAIYNINYRDEDGGGGEAHITISSGSIESPIQSLELFKDKKEIQFASKSQFGHNWANLQQAQDLINKEVDSSGSLASRILKQNNSHVTVNEDSNTNINNLTNKQPSMRIKDNLEFIKHKSESPEKKLFEAPNMTANNVLQNATSPAKTVQNKLQQPSKPKSKLSGSAIKIAGNQTLFGATYVRQSHDYISGNNLMYPNQVNSAPISKVTISSGRTNPEKNQFLKGNGKDDHRDNEQ